MASGTGAKKVNLYAKKILPLSMVKDSFLDYVVDKSEDLYARFMTDDGSYDVLTPVIPTAGVDGVRITAAFAGTDGEGHTIHFGAGDPLLANILFENTAFTVYHIGLRYNMVPALETETNSRTGYVEYVRLEESIGNVADPGAVTDLGATIRLIVDSVTEVGVSHVGRTVRVWLKVPLIDDPVVAFADCAVQWDGFNNFIVTANLLGQTAGLVSVVPADYTVQELGATLQQLASGDLRTTAGVLFLAAITGNGPGAVVLPGNVVTTDQKVIAWTLTGWLEVTRVDVHGDTKIRVSADAFDAGEPQVEVTDSGGATVFYVDETGNGYFTTTPVKSTSVGYGDDVYLGDDSICGGISELQEHGDHIHSPSVLYGLTPTFGGSAVNLTAGSAYYYKTPFVYGLRRGATYRHLVPQTYDFVGKPADTYILCLDNTGAMNHFSSAVMANGGMDDGRVPLALVAFDGANITALVDLRFICNTVNRSTLVTVGTGGAGSRFRAQNFKTLYAAIEWLRRVDPFLTAGGGLYPRAEIVINDGTVETLPSTLDVAGVVIRATSLADGCRVQWDFVGAPMLDVQANDVTIEHVSFRYIGNNIGSVSDTLVTVTGVRNGFRFVDNKVIANGAEGLHEVVRGTGGSLSNSEISRNRVTFSTPHSLGVVQYPFQFNEPVSGLVMDDNVFTGPALPSTVAHAIYFPGGVQATHIRRNRITNVETIAISAPGNTGYLSITDNLIVDVTGQAINITIGIGAGFGNEVSRNRLFNTDVAGTGGTITIDTPQSHVCQNTINDCVNVASVFGEILVSGDDCIVSGNIMENVQAGVTLSGNNCVVSGNHLAANNGSVIISTGSACVIEGNHIDHWGVLGTNVGVDVSGPWTTIVGNVLRADITGGTFGVRINGSAFGTTVTGNTIEIDHAVVAAGAIGVFVDADGVSVTGNTFYSIGDGITGGLGIYVTATSDHIAIVGNTFTLVFGAAIHVVSGSDDDTITGNTCSSAGLAVVVNPVTGAVSLDMITFAAQNGVINSNTVGTLAGGGYCVNLTGTSATSIAQLNHKRAGGAGVIVDAGAGNLVAGGGNL